jgi:hypothetical protein
VSFQKLTLSLESDMLSRLDNAGALLFHEYTVIKVVVIS